MITKRREEKDMGRETQAEDNNRHDTDSIRFSDPFVPESEKEEKLRNPSFEVKRRSQCSVYYQ